MYNILIFSFNSFLTKKFIYYSEQQGKSYNLYFFTHTKKDVNYSKGIYSYEDLESIVRKVGSGFVINFAGANVFKTIFSLNPFRDQIIWRTRIEFTKSMVNIISRYSKDFVFIIPSAVWVYSKYLSKYFHLWEDTVKNCKYMIFRLGIVLSEDCQWIELIRKILELKLNPIFPSSFLFPFIWDNEFFEILFNKIDNNEINFIHDCFKISYFNDFVKFVKEFYGYETFININPDFIEWFVKLFFGKYGKVFDSLCLKIEEVEKCFTLPQKTKINF